MSKRLKFIITILAAFCGGLYEFWLWGVLAMTPQEMVSRTSIWAHAPWVIPLGIAGIVVVIIVCAGVWFGGSIVKRFHNKSSDLEFPLPFSGNPRELIETFKGTYASTRARIFELHEGDRIETEEYFAPPIAFRLLAKTNSTNIRLSYAANQIIFNWEMNADELRIDGGPADGRHKAGVGKVPFNEWVTIDLVVTECSLSLYVDSCKRYQTTADFSGTKMKFSVFQGAHSIVHVKSLLVGKPKLR